MQNRRLLLMVLGFLLAPFLAVTTTVATAAPAHAAYYQPVANNDSVRAPAGTARVKNVLRNDEVHKKAEARVRIVDAPAGVKAWVDDRRRIVVRPRLKAKPGTVFRVKYRVIDHRGNSDTAVLRVRVTKPRLMRLVRAMKVAPKVRDGYDRARFRHWIDADGDCFNTRAEVLLRDTRKPATWNEHCTIQTGEWWSYYDGVTTTTARDFDIDHLVALSDAWASGARHWSDARREAFANDLGDRRSLVAVTASSNRSKGDKHPGEWMPPRKGAHCRYVREWVAVKHRWSLTANRSEKRAIRDHASNCKNSGVLVRWR